MMPRACVSTRRALHLKREALGPPFGKKKCCTSSPQVAVTLSPMELFFPIPESLMIPPKSQKPKYHQRKRVTFQSNVQIQEIPSHRSYDQEIKQRIWMDMDALKEMVQRNRLEMQKEFKDVAMPKRICAPSAA